MFDILKVVFGNKKVLKEKIRLSPWLFRYVIFQTEELIVECTKINPLILNFCNKIPDQAAIIALETGSFAFIKPQIRLLSKQIIEKIVSEYNGTFLSEIEDQTEELCLAAVKQNPSALKYVKNQTEEICLEAVKGSGIVLQHVKNKTEEVCLAAVTNDGIAIAFIKNPSERVCIAAVQQTDIALKFITNEKIKEKCKMIVEMQK